MQTITALLTGRRPLTVGLRTSAFEAALAMNEVCVGAALVVDDQGLPVGIFTERDLMSRVVVPRKSPDQVRMSEVMTSDMYSASPTQSVAEVRKELQRRHIRHLPVVEHGRIIELLSLRDLLRADLDERVDTLENLTQYIQGSGEIV